MAGGGKSHKLGDWHVALVFTVMTGPTPSHGKTVSASLHSIVAIVFTLCWAVGESEALEIKALLWKHIAISFYSVYASICQTKS